MQAHTDSSVLSNLNQAGRDRVVMDGLPGLTLGLAVLQTAIAVSHAMLGTPAERPFIFVDLASAALALALRVALGRGYVPERWAHPFAAGCCVLASLVVLLHQYVLTDPMQSLMLILVMIGAGSILLSFRWLSVVAVISLAGWFLVMAGLGLPPATRRLGTALVGSWALAGAILAARMRSFRRLEELREQGETRLKGDLVEARRITDSMRRSEEQHRLLFEKSPLPMWVIAKETLQFLAVNDAAAQTYGYSEEEFLEMTLPDLLLPEDVPNLMRGLALRIAEQGTPITRRHRKKDGTVIDVEIVAHATAFEEWVALLAAVTDVTERKRAEDALRRSREGFQQLFEEAPVGMAMIASGIFFTKVNRALCTMLGYSREELTGLSFERFVDPESLPAHLAAAEEFFSKDRKSFKMEGRYLRQNGEPLWGSLTVERIDDSTGRMLFVLVMIEDISERRAAAAEKERMIEELRESLASIKTLRGLIPICASCKKVRDDTGYWSQVEVYVRDHSEAEFSHGICPECMKKLYGR